MRAQFPLFQSHLDLAHCYWNTLLKEGGWAIDATCGNGKDTLMLSRLLTPFPKNSGIVAIDLQPDAIAATQTLLGENPGIPVHLFCQSHAEFPSLAYEKEVRLIVYNLGYLPKGDKQITTTATSTLSSLYNAKELLCKGGAISIACYPGHPEGAQEQQLLLEALALFPATSWNICHHQFPNRTLSPSLLLLQKEK